MADRTEVIEIRLLPEALFQKYHFNFRGYAMASLKRLKRGRLAPRRQSARSATPPPHRR